LLPSSFLDLCVLNNNNNNICNNNSSSKKATFSDRPLKYRRLLYREYVSASSVSVGKFGHFLRPCRTDPLRARFCHCCVLTARWSVGSHTIAVFLSSFSLIGGAERRLRHGYFLTLPCLLITRTSFSFRKVIHKHRLFRLMLFPVVLCPSGEMPENCFNSEYDLSSPYPWQFVIDL
jgi:hypothetical protein